MHLTYSWTEGVGGTLTCRLGPSRLGSRCWEDFRILPQKANCLLKCPECARRNCPNIHTWTVGTWYASITQQPDTLLVLCTRHEYKTGAPTPVLLLQLFSLLSSPLSSCFLTLFLPYPQRKGLTRDNSFHLYKAVLQLPLTHKLGSSGTHYVPLGKAGSLLWELWSVGKNTTPSKNCWEDLMI